MTLRLVGHRDVRPATPHRRRVGPKWLLIGLVFAMFCSVLLLNGLVRSQIGIDARGAGLDGADGLVPASVAEGGPVIDLTHGRRQSISLPPKTVALTFDDGPDPTWTPQILAVLAKYHVPGTFFVVGSSVARDPALVREIRAEGSEIGIHTFTHPDLAEVSPDRVDREMAETQYALAGATGELSYLIRPPYSSEPDALDNQRFGVISRLGSQGYVTALVDVDSLDWERPGVDAIVHNAVPEDGHGGVVLLHDAGGDRSQTVAALDRLIPEMQRDGFTFTTVSKGAGLPPANFAAGPVDLALGKIMLVAVAIAQHIVSALEWSLLLVGGLVVLRTLLVMVVALRHGRRIRRARRAVERGASPLRRPPSGTVTVVVPAFNECVSIESTVRSVAASTHPVDIVVVDDGSTDGTAELVEALGLANVRVIRQLNAGKAAALNTGIATSRHDIVVLIDGDTVFEPGTVAALMEPFADSAVGAVAGNARVANRSGLLSRLQNIEYVVGFNVDRRVQDSWNVVTTIPGAVGAFRIDALRAVGGISADTLAEDTDVAIALGRDGWRVVYQPAARAWTEAPATLGQLWRQRYRWSYGIMQSLWKHRHAVVERGASGHMGRVGLGLTALFQIVLPLLAPLVDIYLVYGLVFLDPVVTAITWGGVMFVQLLLGAVAFRLEGERLRALWLLPAQQLVYRQLMYAVLIQSIATAAAGIALRWQKIPRTGDFSAVPLARPAS
jgi:cellulose synthase/poly-beta-1,6-N-acetylglucosamine synthase-like glycosyltransferase/peptidoglycan/xylan/chitin deacetylase (PgdA/CDA1 family)